MGPPVEREREIREALGNLIEAGHVRLDVTRSAEAVLLAEGVGAAGVKPRVSLAMLESGVALRFGSREQFVEAAGRVLVAADRIYAHAWALQRHEAVAVPGRPQMTAFWLRHALVNDHLVELRKELRVVRGVFGVLARETVMAEGLRGKPVFELANGLNLGMQHFLQSEDAKDLDAARPGPDVLWGTLEALEKKVSALEARSRVERPGGSRMGGAAQVYLADDLRTPRDAGLG